MPDRIALRGITAFGHHGVFPHERENGQHFVVDVVCSLDLAAAAASDDLAQTLDYGLLASRVVADVERDPLDLIEALAGRIADTCLSDPRVDEVEVTVHKPEAPVPVTVADVAVTLDKEHVMTSPNPYAIDTDTLSGMKPLSKVVYSVGSNLGDRLANLQGAVDAIRDTPDVIVVDVSHVYETEAVGGPEGNPAFLNLVLVAETTLDPRTLLERAQAVEDAYGRVREERWGPRTLDVDLIMVGRSVRDEEDLKVPHPLAHTRGFVLVPWAEIDPRAELPGHGPLVDLLAGVDTAGVARREDLRIERD